MPIDVTCLVTGRTGKGYLIEKLSVQKRLYPFLQKVREVCDEGRGVGVLMKEKDGLEKAIRGVQLLSRSPFHAGTHKHTLVKPEM